MGNSDSQGPLWEVFVQSKPGLAFKHVGSVHAYDKNSAIGNARDLYTRRNEGSMLWVVLSSEIVAVPLEASEEFFEPNMDKIYRHPTFYEVPDGVKHM
ncbi:MAG: ring-1,2-phenylacetyl-CoA epoxidase subunit PaaB [Parvicellaceae bacterium]|jgi:ring-1,2-phenylacetyl-CoA epoxidase subunit PaaB